jgi:hypothetical protein
MRTTRDSPRGCSSLNDLPATMIEILIYILAVIGKQGRIRCLVVSAVDSSGVCEVSGQ